MSAAYVLTKSQQDVVEFLRNVPRSSAINVLVRQQINPVTGSPMSPTVEISGGSQYPELASKCHACESHFYGENVSFTFKWYRGKFREAYVHGEHRRSLKSIERAIAVGTQLIEKGEALHAKHRAINERLAAEAAAL